MSRERSRNRIVFLEQKLKSLEARDRGGQISHLMKVIEDLRQENTQLRASMMKIRFIADDLCEPANRSTGRMQHEEDSSQSTSSPQDHDLEMVHGRQKSDTPMDTIPELDQTSQALDSISPDQFIPPASTALIANGYPLPIHGKGAISNQQANMNGDFPDYDVSLLTELANFEATMAAWSQPGFDWDFTNASGPLPLAADVEKWNVSDTAFLQALELCRTTTNTDPTLDPDVPVKAILWGWHTVDAAQRHHPVWQALRQVDERVFGNWTSKAQKIAMMYVCQLMMQYRASPTKENLDAVPPWFRPSRSQERIDHPLVIDFLIWPGLREHLVFEHNRYAPNAEFSHRFCEDLRFNWPYPDSDIFCFDPTKNTYTFSRRFRQSACDLRNWTMDAKFFEAFREMVGDVPMSHDPVAGTWGSGPEHIPQQQGAGGFQQGSRAQAV